MPPFLDGGDFLTIPHLHNLVPDLKLGRLQLEKQLVWGAAIDYLSRIEMQKIHSYEVS
ncbi:hypothetical protein IC582_024616 [Cucumis melo]